MARNNSSPTSKKFLKKIKKRLDKIVKVWYNKHSERESSKRQLTKSLIPLAVDHSALSQKVVKPPDSEKELSESRANKSGKKFLKNT